MKELVWEQSEYIGTYCTHITQLDLFEIFIVETSPAKSVGSCFTFTLSFNFKMDGQHITDARFRTTGNAKAGRTKLHSNTSNSAKQEAIELAIQIIDELKRRMG